MEVLINAGGRGTRMGAAGVEKPMSNVGGVPVVKRVIDAVSSSDNVTRVLVSVSDNTHETEKYLRSIGVETLRTSGTDFVDDIHRSFEVMNGKFVMMLPSDIPLMNKQAVDILYNFFDPDTMESVVAVIDESTVRSAGIVPSYTVNIGGKNWVLSGLHIMDREKTLQNVFLKETYMLTDWFDLAVNVNTPRELELARKICSSQRSMSLR